MPNAIARQHGCKCLVTGENLGQVASQTMEAMAVTGAVVHMPLFHPLIGMDKEDISDHRPADRHPGDIHSAL